MRNGNIDIFMISETMLDETFPAAQLSVEGIWDPYRFNHNHNGGGTILNIREDVPSRVIEKRFWNNSEYFFIEINLRNKKWLLCYSYNPPNNSVSIHIDFLRREHLSPSNHENFMLLRDFNSEMTDSI